MRNIICLLASQIKSNATLSMKHPLLFNLSVYFLLNFNHTIVLWAVIQSHTEDVVYGPNLIPRPPHIT